MALRRKTATLTVILGMIATSGGTAAGIASEQPKGSGERVAVRAIDSAGGVVVPIETGARRTYQDEEDPTPLPPAA